MMQIKNTKFDVSDVFCFIAMLITDIETQRHTNKHKYTKKPTSKNEIFGFRESEKV